MTWKRKDWSRATRRDAIDDSGPSWREVFELIGRNGPMTAEEIGEVFGVSKQRIDQITHRALRKLELWGKGQTA